jgi:uncharacterized protein
MEVEVDTRDPVLDEIVRRLVGEFSPERIYLFGSRARGDAGSDSDYDMVVLLRQRQRPIYELAERAQEVLWGIPVGADVLVWDAASFDSRSSVDVSFPGTILREGRLLYRAA